MTDEKNEMRLEAYYYCFEETGVEEIDLILSAVACAGKAFHHTCGWVDPVDFDYPFMKRGKSPEEWIQHYADKAAQKMRSLGKN